MIGANEYGSALFELTEELGTSENVKDEIGTVAKLLSENTDYAKLLDTPALGKEERLALIDAAFSALDTNLVNLIKILCERRCVYSFARVYAAYLSAYDKARGIERVTAITAVPMSAEQISAMTKKLGDMTGKTVIISNTVDPAILGGVKLRCAGKQLDGSVKTRLDKFERSLKNIVL